jgi:hypothetical protein
MGSSLDPARSPARRTTDIPGHLPLHTRGLSLSADSFQFIFLIQIHPPHWQFVRNVGITHGDESLVGYYVGMMVRLVLELICLTHLR